MFKWLKKAKKQWYKIYFITASVFFIFIYGVIVGTYHIFPFDILNSTKDAAAEGWLWMVNWKHYMQIKPEKHLHPARYEGTDVTTYIPEKVSEGVTFVVSMWDQENPANGFNLIEMDGTVIHQWRVSFNEIWGDATHLDWESKVVNDWETEIHGAHLYPNGDVIFNFEYGGLSKIDKCSNLLWKLPYITHHSIYVDDDENLWVPGRKIHNLPVDQFPLLIPPFREEFILKISPAGKILKEISILDVFFKSGLESILFANGQFDPTASGDITHMNQIEILEEHIADQFPLFSAGDIMVSMRHLNLIIIIDPITERIKWEMTGPYIRQHDPHFLSNGNIAVFDNRSDQADGAILGGSRILSINPVTRQTQILYEGNQQNNFYTQVGGKFQYLPNENILITENGAGRVFEVTPTGEIAWSFINRYDDDEVYTISQGTRYQNNYSNLENFSKEACQ